MVKMMPLSLLTSCLVQTDDKSFVEDISDPTEIASRKDPPRLGLMIILEASSLYGQGDNFMPMVGVAIVYKPPYVSAVNFSRTVFILEFALKAEGKHKIKPNEPQVVLFLNISSQSQVRPLADPYPL